MKVPLFNYGYELSERQYSRFGKVLLDLNIIQSIQMFDIYNNLLFSENLQNIYEQKMCSC